MEINKKIKTQIVHWKGGPEDPCYLKTIYTDGSNSMEEITSEEAALFRAKEGYC